MISESEYSTRVALDPRIRQLADLALERIVYEGTPGGLKGVGLSDRLRRTICFALIEYMLLAQECALSASHESVKRALEDFSAARPTEGPVR